MAAHANRREANRRTSEEVFVRLRLCEDIRVARMLVDWRVHVPVDDRNVRLVHVCDHRGSIWALPFVTVWPLNFIAHLRNHTV